MKGPQIRLPCRRQCRRCHTRNAEQDFSFARLVSITSWRNVNGSVLLDQDATPLEVVRASYVQHDKTITEEVHLLSKSGAMPWIAGVYYFNDLSAYDPLDLMGEAAAPLDETQIWSAQKSKSYAAFWQINPKIAADTHLTLGARYTKDDRMVRGSTRECAARRAYRLGVHHTALRGRSPRGELRSIVNSRPM
jgi:hypothetical protein